MKFFLISIFIHVSLFLFVSGTFEKDSKILKPHVHSNSKVIHISLKIKPEDIRDPVKKVAAIRKSIRKVVKETKAKKDSAIKKMMVRDKSSKIIGEKELQKYFAEIRSFIEKRKYYPKKALKMRQSGDVEICVDIDHNGHFHDIHIKTKSRYETLNIAALNLIQEISKFKPLPKEIGKKITLNIPIKYALN